MQKLVAPFRGARIETTGESITIPGQAPSHPLGVRELKHVLLVEALELGYVAPFRGA